MGKKGRGIRKTTKRQKTAFEKHCPFWLFVLFAAGWSAIAFCVVVIFYVSLRAPGGQDLVYRFQDEVAKLKDMKVDRAIQMMDEKIDETEAVVEDVMEETTPSVTIESCRPLEEGDEEVGAITSWDNIMLRQMGDRCVLSDGRVFVTFTFNRQVPYSERFYVQQGIEIFKDGKSLNSHAFYCRTSPRGTPATITTNGNRIELDCSFSEGGKEVRRSIALNDNFSVNVIETVNHINNAEGYRTDTGDGAREYCVNDTGMHEKPDNDFARAFDRYHVGNMGSACRLRNGTWVIADGGDRVLVVQADGSVRETSVDQQGREPLIIGSEGSNVDIWYVVGDGGYFGESILRLDTRTLGTQELFAEEKISS